ncbi:putative carbohydrate-binding protein with CBM5 and CBM33 domain [Burkholderia pyrrocinia]|uniref:Putative carbohydrate-binding protein with CBM5 and CBM33 domain n=2 Tax=Burkholderiaceae TaxID=119060 RepID=A0A318I5A9_BURPY|nr:MULTISPECIES: lytic polysaccharide monooxygenase [Burkholderia]PXX25825.1 putative carbohydrate-binding protein with CBM5 and CBM33 domain [Burkholderia pyrrocinia]SFW83665.1 Chitin binding domain-containing protein [Burkholderia sp. NFACC33-1]SFY44789.1 Chitin binding domain-containing protein [Burkholderia sp. NFPP32]
MKSIIFGAIRYRPFPKTRAAFWLSFITATGTAIAPLQEAAAHGAVGFPIARQYQCYLEGGFGNGNPADVPQNDCRAAYEAGGKLYWPFQQWNEISANPNNQGNSMEDVRRAVPDGRLCAGGDERNRGLDTPTTWRKTRIIPKNGHIELIWENSQAHNPARMRIFISKPYYNSAQSPLRWEDLEKIYDEDASPPVPANGAGHLPGTIQTFYKLNVSLPPGRTGDAVILSYWQRKDSGNEGFFNCSDVTIAADEGNPGFPWIERGSYVERGFAPQPNQQVRFRVMGGSARGLEVVDVYHRITAENAGVQIWAKELADLLNRQHANYVTIGVRSGDTIHYDPSDVSANKVWLKAGYSLAMGIVIGDIPEPGKPSAHITAPESVVEHSPTQFSAQGSQGEKLTYIWTIPSFKPDTATTENVTATAGPTQPSPVTVTLTVTDDKGQKSEAQKSITITPIGGGGGEKYDHVFPEGLGSYQAGTKVLQPKNNHIYQCKLFPASGWCNIWTASATHYEPGTGSNWQDAWTDLGPGESGR